MSFEPANGVVTGIIHVGGGFDVAETLPPNAADRLRRLRQWSSDLNRLLPDFADIKDLSDRKVAAETRLRQLTDHRSENGFHLHLTDLRVTEQQKTVAKLTDELQRLRALDAERSAAWRVASQLVAAVEEYVKNGRPPGTALEDYDGTPPQLVKNETILDGIERLRLRGRELKANLHTIRSAPYPSAHVRAKIRAEVLAMAEAAAPVVSDVVEHDRSIVWPTRSVRAEILSERPTFAATEVHDALGLFAWLHKDALIAALDKLVTEESDDAAALSHVEREKREAEVLGDLLDIERQEATLIWQALDQRLPVEHRSDISPVALLAVQIVTAPRGVAPASIAFDIVHYSEQQRRP
jgi:hypothetical protein